MNHNKDEVEKLVRYYFNCASIAKVTYLLVSFSFFVLGIISSFFSKILFSYLGLNDYSLLPIFIGIIFSIVFIFVSFRKEKEYLYKAYLLKETHELNMKNK